MSKTKTPSKIVWADYDSGSAWDELMLASGEPRPAAEKLARQLAALSGKRLKFRQRAAERAIVEMGITFTVYSEGENIDRAWPFDVIPRTLDAKEWRTTEAGLKQRLRALNCFIDDVYHDRRMVADGRFPADVLETSANYLPACQGANPPLGVWANICGSDLSFVFDVVCYEFIQIFRDMVSWCRGTFI